MDAITFAYKYPEYDVGQIPYGPYAGQWVWSTDTHEGEPLATEEEARKDAIRHANRPEPEPSEEDIDAYHRELNDDCRREAV